jgi:hypothetical protein
MATHRDDILEKIRNLRAKASNAASTEAEAQTAAMMAAKLLQKHDVKETELEIQQEGAAHKKAEHKAKVMPEILHYCARGIERLTETKVYAEGIQLCYIGTPHDVEMALYLTEMLVGASKRAWIDAAEATGKTDFKALTIARLSFYRGFGTRVSDRLIDMANERAEARMKARGTATGSALVVVKSALIEAKMKEMGLTLVPGKAREFGALDPAAYQMGAGAGDRVNLNRPVEGEEGWGALT